MMNFLMPEVNAVASFLSLHGKVVASGCGQRVWLVGVANGCDQWGLASGVASGCGHWDMVSRRGLLRSKVTTFFTTWGVFLKAGFLG